ncbi:hypothetical protein [Salinicola sp. CPA57]|uniref:hypothetical protein n=1 Tax=Salinicola sp. CPA57 TaxID=1949080 RepID=UPI000DA1AA01|nr:hypothetical protein [Salinicola sp. CPA57]
MTDIDLIVALQKQTAALDRQTAALDRQTAAMHELAESNRAVVDMLIAQESEPGEDREPATLLDGTPAR